MNEAKAEMAAWLDEWKETGYWPGPYGGNDDEGDSVTMFEMSDMTIGDGRYAVVELEDQ